ncbi:MAG TPA: DUF2510 domain-containing protein [Solirubrobacteraceae bacterium]|nr:DUF2510 domain-containing protein [Solirubrobacteraceae bacterium]
MGSDGQRPSAAGYWIAGLVALLGLAAGAALIATSVGGIADALKRLERIPAPGQRVLTLAAGKHAVYIESGERPPRPEAVGVTVRQASNGRRVALARYASSLTYTSGNRSGLAAYTFVASRRGRYRIVASSPPGGDVAVVVGPPLGGGLVRTITGAVGGFGLLLLGLVAGVVIALITGSRQRGFERDAAAAAGGVPGAAPAGPGAGPGAAPGAAATGEPGAAPPGEPAAAAAALPPAAWYPDPWRQARLRWWDGQGWTGHTS